MVVKVVLVVVSAVEKASSGVELEYPNLLDSGISLELASILSIIVVFLIGSEKFSSKLPDLGRSKGERILVSSPM